MTTKPTLNRFNSPDTDSIDLLADYLECKLSLYEISKKVLSGKIPQEFRSIIFKIFLNILPYKEPLNWEKYWKESRNCYQSTLSDLLSKNDKIIPFINCSFLKGTPQYDDFIQYFSQEEFALLSLIKLDVDRTFQELDLFHDKKTKELLCKIWYVYSKRNPDPSYCQGMNEILGTWFYALLPSVTIHNSVGFNKDKVVTVDSKEINVTALYNTITTDIYFEADWFSMYEEIMSRDLKELYTYHDQRFEKLSDSFDKRTLTLDIIKNSSQSDLQKRIQKIFYIYLNKSCKELYDFISDKIEPDIFLLRWILCILNREISLNNVLWLWDAIIMYEFIEFTVNTVEIDRSRMNFLDYWCVAMIDNWKDLLLQSEETGGLLWINFLQYPNEKNLREIIKRAVEISAEWNDSDNRGNLWDDGKLKNKLW